LVPSARRWLRAGPAVSGRPTSPGAALPSATRYGVDGFTAIEPAAGRDLAVGRIADRVVAVNGPAGSR
jgi:hypothetical protein